MKRRLKSTLIAVLLALATLFALAGCSFRLSLEEYLEKNNLVARVTYYTNGGVFNDDRNFKDMYYKEGDLPLNINVSDIESGTITLTRVDHEFLGWYFVEELDENGEPVKDEFGEIKMGAEVDFSVPMQKGDHWNVCAMWATLSKVKVKLACEATETIKIETSFSDTLEWKECKNGDVIRDYSFWGGYMQSTVEPSVNVENNSHTFLKFYADAECTQEIVWPIAQPEKDAAEKDVYIYAKYIKGDWNVIRNAEDVENMFATSDKEGENFYLVNDVDCFGETFAPATGFKGTLLGNGYTIKNFKLEQIKIIDLQKVSLLGNIAATAKIENVTFSEFTAEYSTMSDVIAYAYLAFSSLGEGATVNNVTIDGKVTVTLGKGATLLNSATDNWKFGGFETDAAYEASLAEGEVGVVVSETSSFEVKNA